MWSYDVQKISLSSRIKLAMKHNFVGKLFANICKAVIWHRAAFCTLGSCQPFAATQIDDRLCAESGLSA